MDRMMVAIDPGLNGGIAWQFDGKVNAVKMPETLGDIHTKLVDLATYGPKCVIEKVGDYMPGNSGPAAVKFARHCGHLEMGLYAAGISTLKVAPSTWQHWLIGKPNYPKIPKEINAKERSRILAHRKTERKNKIKDAVQRRFPELKVTLATSDALGILLWALNQK